MDVIISAASPQEWWWLAKACAWLAVIGVIGALIEGPLASLWRSWQHLKDQEWRSVPPPNYRSSRGGREYW